jgi:small GTP-binding protein
MQNWDCWSVRIVLLGDSMVGKSTLVLRAAGRPLPKPLAPTIGIDYDRAYVTVEGEKFSLQLWDTAGQERFRSIVDGYYRGAACLLLCIASDSLESLKSVQDHWYPQAKDRNPSAVCALVLTKTDCGNGQVEQLTREWARQHDLTVFPTQCLGPGAGVTPMLEWIATAVKAAQPIAGLSKPLNVTAAPPPPPPPVDFACCRLM